MNKDLNNLIVRKKFNNYIVNGRNKNMDYRVSEELSNLAKELINKERVLEEFKILKNQISFLTSGDELVLSGSTLTNEDAGNIKQNISKINDGIDVLNFKKQTLEVELNNCLTKMDINNAIDIKTKINKLNSELNSFENQKKELDGQIDSSKIDFKTQIVKIREKYDEEDVLKIDFSQDGFSKNVVYEYKKERASKLLDSFLSSLTPEMQKQILEENQDLKEIKNVGEDI